MSDLSVVLGDDHAQHLRLTVYSRERPETGDYDDDNWLNSLVSIRVTGFRGDFATSIRSDDFASLATVLRAHRRGGPSPTSWAPMEPWVELTFEKSGDVVAMAGLATERFGDGNQLRFSMPVTAAQIERALEEVDLVLAVFPVPPYRPVEKHDGADA